MKRRGDDNGRPSMQYWDEDLIQLSRNLPERRKIKKTLGKRFVDNETPGWYH